MNYGCTKEQFQCLLQELIYDPNRPPQSHLECKIKTKVLAQASTELFLLGKIQLTLYVLTSECRFSHFERVTLAKEIEKWVKESEELFPGYPDQEF